jgi:hypothetical protein
MTSRRVRPAYLAGSWYPAANDQLAAAVDAYMATASGGTLPGDVVGLVAPHAGYAFSGPIAGHAYAQVKGKRIGTVVLLGLAHRVDIGPYGVPAYTHLSTPLGLVEVDDELVNKLREENELTPVRSDDHENSIEIQLPFVQRALGEVKIVPIMMGFSLSAYAGDEGWQVCQELSASLVRALSGRTDVLLIASSDLTHDDDYRTVERQDAIFEQLLEAFDAQELARALTAETCQACGGAAVVVAMLTAQALGANKATVLSYAHSGQITGRIAAGQYTVGYAAAAFSRVAGS